MWIEILNTLYMPTDKSCNRNLVVIALPAGTLINQERLNFIPQEETRSQHNTQTKCITNTIPLICSSKGPFTFLRNHLLIPKRPTDLLRERIHVS